MASAEPHRLLVVGAGSIGGVVAASLLVAGHAPVALTTNREIAAALRERGFDVRGKRSFRVSAGPVVDAIAEDSTAFDVIFLAVQPPQVEAACRSVTAKLASDGRVVCFQNGLCEERVARIVGCDRVLGAVVAWGASMLGPGRYERTSRGGFSVGRLQGAPDDRARAIGRILDCIGPVVMTDNLLGARWSKLAINCAISTLGTIGGDRVGALMRHRFARRLALEIMTETVHVARAEGIRLEKVAGTIDLDWLALPDLNRKARRREDFVFSEPQKPFSPSRLPVNPPLNLALAARHAVLFSAGIRYRKLRSSMLAAIERGRPPAVDFLNGEVVERAGKHGIEANVNRAAAAFVWQIARGERRPSLESLRNLYDSTR